MKMWRIKQYTTILTRRCTMKKLFLASLVVVFAFIVALMPYGVAQATNCNADAAENKDIVDTAVGAGSFNTLVAAVKAAELVDTLKGAGPFTVFAPTDAAFAKLPAGTLDDLLKPENKAKLQAILTYHVVAGKVMAADVVGLDGQMVETVGGGSLPGQVLPTALLALPVVDPMKFIVSLRSADPPVIGRIQEDRIVLDPRTVLPEQDDRLIEVIMEILTRIPRKSE